jgi:uncharacterized small protein (DUF1192 family)
MDTEILSSAALILMSLALIVMSVANLNKRTRIGQLEREIARLKSEGHHD